MFYCGIDIAKYKHEATVIDGAGAALLDSIRLEIRQQAALGRELGADGFALYRYDSLFRNTGWEELAASEAAALTQLP